MTLVQPDATFQLNCTAVSPFPHSTCTAYLEVQQEVALREEEFRDELLEVGDEFMEGR